MKKPKADPHADPFDEVMARIGNVEGENYFEAQRRRLSR